MIPTITKINTSSSSSSWTIGAPAAHHLRHARSHRSSHRALRNGLLSQVCAHLQHRQGWATTQHNRKCTSSSSSSSGPSHHLLPLRPACVATQHMRQVPCQQPSRQQRSCPTDPALSHLPCGHCQMYALNGHPQGLTWKRCAGAVLHPRPWQHPAVVIAHSQCSACQLPVT